jgi:nitrous oxide reductase accessory protein NosL
MLAESINEKLDETIGEFKKRDERIIVLRDMADQAKWNEEQMQKQIDELKSSIDAFNGS